MLERHEGDELRERLERQWELGEQRQLRLFGLVRRNVLAEYRLLLRQQRLQVRGDMLRDVRVVQHVLRRVVHLEVRLRCLPAGVLLEV